LKILGIDPGSLVTGYGVVLKDKGGRLTHVCDGRIKLDGRKPLSERLLEISETLNRVITEFAPDAVAVESIFFAKNVKSAIMLGQARGATLLCAASSGLEVFEYDPRSIKLAVTGYGNATKEQVQKMVKNLLNTPTAASPDASDALATAICHIHHFREEKLIS
jgi:crossover junction endodeoxyribonuclease RuvC